MEQQVSSAAEVVDGVVESAILKEQKDSRLKKFESERTVVLRVYNYFRIVISFFLLIVFYEVSGQSFVGAVAPDIFQTVAIVYLMLNVGAGFAVLVSKDKRLSNATAIATIVVFDIFFLSLLLCVSGGVESGLGYLILFTVAFGSVMLGGQMSFLFPAIATVNCITSEIYLHNAGEYSESQHFFEVAILGTAFFVVNYFFQYVSRQLEIRDREVVGLETLSRLHQIAEKSRQELEISNARFTVLLTSTGEGVLGLDMDGTVTFANPRACLLLDIDYEDLIACDIQRFMIADSGSKSTRAQKILELLGIEAKNSYDFFNWRTAKDEAFVIEYSCEATVNKNAERTGAVLLFRNVTQERGNEERVQYLANHDDLTGLANRANFHEVLKNAVARRRNSRSLAVAIVDTDHFAVINEKYGQQAGDQLLKQIATRLKSSIREGDHVARLHSDQFAIMLADLNIAEDAAMVAEQIIKEASAPMLFNLEEITTSTSVGIAILGEGEKDAEELISRAISALDNAKAEGRNTYRFFNPDMQEKVEEKKRVQILLRNAAENDEFTMVYQPIVDVKLGKIYSSEALIRWTPAGEEPIRPDIFIPIAEESGQINSIGAWVLSTVSKQVKNWSDDLGVCPSIALNISTKQLKDSVFREHFIEMLRVYDIPVHVVELELTETGVMEDEDKCFEELIELHKLGVKLSMDDFGTGYSSLDYLRRLPLDILKIDQSFTRGIGVSENDEEIVRVMIRMAHAMGLRVICEGCETKAHLDFLIEHDCDLVQGYYFSRPKSVQDITALFIAERDGKINIMDGDAS